MCVQYQSPLKSILLNSSQLIVWCVWLVFFFSRHITKFWLDYDLAHHNSDGQGRQCVYLIIFS